MGRDAQARDLMNERDRRYEQRFTDLDRALTAALAATEKATDIASSVMNQRLDTMNEFRGALTDQTAQFVTRQESATQRERDDERYQLLQRAVQDLTDRVNVEQAHGAGRHATWLIAVALVGVLGTAVAVVLALVNVLT